MSATSPLAQKMASRRASRDGGPADAGAVPQTALSRVMGRSPTLGGPADTPARRTSLQMLRGAGGTGTTPVEDEEEGKVDVLGASPDMTSRKSKVTSSGSAEGVTPLGSRRPRGFRAGREMLG